MARIEVIGEEGQIEVVTTPSRIEIEGDQGQIEVDQGGGRVQVVPQDNNEVELQILGGRGPIGPVGEKGDKGDPGEPGSGPADAAYTHLQDIPASTWIIIHDLNKMPSVTVVDSAGTRVEGDIFYISLNQIDVVFGAAFAGKAYLN